MNIEFELKEYLKEQFETVNKQFETVNKQFETVNKRFDTINDQFQEMKVDINNIKAELKDHREKEEEILIEIAKFKTHSKWLMTIGIGIIGVLIKQFFFS